MSPDVPAANESDPPPLTLTFPWLTSELPLWNAIFPPVAISELPGGSCAESGCDRNSKMRFE